MIPTWQMAAYQRLRIEIMKGVVRELKSAVRKSNRDGKICPDQKKLERWLLSPWGQMLSGDNGEYIIERCRNAYKTRPNKKGGGVSEA